MKQYHKDIYFKPWFEYVCTQLIETRMIYASNHLRERMSERNIDSVKFDVVLDLIQDRCKPYEIFEVKMEGRYIKEIAIRTPYNRISDLIIVLADGYNDETAEAFLTVKTAWLNNYKDNHETIDYTRYETEE